MFKSKNHTSSIPTRICHRSGCVTKTCHQCPCGRPYCSTACQRTDWNAHKLSCRSHITNTLKTHIHQPYLCAPHKTGTAVQYAAETSSLTSMNVKTEPHCSKSPNSEFNADGVTFTAVAGMALPVLISGDVSIEHPPALRPVCDTFIVSFLDWLTAQSNISITTIDFGVTRTFVNTTKKLHNTGIPIAMSLQTLISLCLIGPVIHMDCALSVVVLNAFIKGAVNVSFLFPLKYNVNPDNTINPVTRLITTTLAEYDNGRICSPTLGYNHARQWICRYPNSATFVGMMSNGLHVGPMDAWKSHMIDTHEKLKVYSLDITTSNTIVGSQMLVLSTIARMNPNKIEALVYNGDL